jgi:hypothetical protein
MRTAILIDPGAARRAIKFLSAYDTGHTSPSSRFAASWKPRVE